MWAGGRKTAAGAAGVLLRLGVWVSGAVGEAVVPYRFFFNDHLILSMKQTGKIFIGKWYKIKSGHIIFKIRCRWQKHWVNIAIISTINLNINQNINLVIAPH